MAIDPSQGPELTEAAEKEGAAQDPVAKVNAVMAHVNYGLAAAQRGIEKRGAEQEKTGSEAELHSRINQKTKEGHAEEEGENLFMKSQKAIAQARQDKTEKPVPEPTSTRQPRPPKLF